MKRLIILMIASMLMGGGVEIGEYSFGAGSSGNASAYNGSLTMELPEEFLKVEGYSDGDEYFAKGCITNDAGESIECDVFTRRFFQAEELYLKYNTFKDFIVGTCHRSNAKNGELTFLQEDVSFGDSAMGYLTHYSVFKTNRYAAYIKGEGAYYMVFIEAEGEIDQTAAVDILSSIKVNAIAEKREVDNFTLRVEDERYYSDVLEGASIMIPYNWEPTEGERFVYPNCILSMKSNGSGSTITVRMVSKEQMDAKNYLEVYDILYNESIQRGDCSGKGEERLVMESNTPTGIIRALEIYDLVPAIFVGVMQDETHYYIIEGELVFNDYYLAVNVMEIALSFETENGLLNNNYNVDEKYY